MMGPEIRNQIWLVRHGETAWTISGQHTSRTDLPLTPEGESRGEHLRSLLNGRDFALVLSSPRKRASETARLAGYQAEIDLDLSEWDYGEYEGLTTTEIQKTAPGWTIWTGGAPGGESVVQVGARADRVIARVSAVQGDVVLFGHGHFSRVLAARWLGLDARQGRLFAVSTASVSVLGYERDTRVIQLWNRTK
jgi:broad specificity phosphatase PhoE